MTDKVSVKYADQTVMGFISALASASPAPGGGGAAALTAAAGISLTCMVCSLTLGKAKYAEYQELMDELIAKAGALKNACLAAIDDDAAAYNRVGAALALPKQSPDEQEARRAALQAALKDAAGPPMALLVLCLDALRLTERAVGKSNASAASDLGVAALLLAAAARAAWLNVAANVKLIRDAAFNEQYTREGMRKLDEAAAAADRIYAEISRG